MNIQPLTVRGLEVQGRSSLHREVRNFLLFHNRQELPFDLSLDWEVGDELDSWQAEVWVPHNNEPIGLITVECPELNDAMTLCRNNPRLLLENLCGGRNSYFRGYPPNTNITITIESKNITQSEIPSRVLDRLNCNTRLFRGN